MKILFVGYKYLHHSKYGGYDWISKYPKSDYFDIRTVPFLGPRWLEKRGGRFVPAIATALSIVLSRKYDVVHFFYADRCLPSPHFIRRKTKVIATTHLRSSDYSKKYISKLKRCDAVIALSSEEERKLQGFGIHAVFLPHGFSIPQFTYKNPKDLSSKKVNIFFSGSNYRDEQTFFYIAAQMHSLRPDIMFHAVGQCLDWKKRMSSMENITVYSFLSDDDYYSLLSECDYNFLPLTFATANNALLEAQALGITSILPKISGIEDYASEKCNLFYESADVLCSLFANLKKNTSNNELIGFARQFEWKNIYEKLRLLYEDAK